MAPKPIDAEMREIDFLFDVREMTNPPSNGSSCPR
jgi:hypothetical protein